MLKITGNKLDVPLLNLLEPPSTAELDILELEGDDGIPTNVVKVKPQKSQLTILPIRMHYVKSFYNPADEFLPAELPIKLRVDDSRIRYIRVNNKEEPSSDFGSSHESETPITAGAPPSSFSTKPSIDHCQELMSDRQFSELQRVLTENEDLFSKNKTDIGHTHVLKHTITLNEGSKPFKEQVRRMNTAKMEAISQTVKEMLDAGLIKESYSPFSSGIVMVSKKDGTYRMCIDFRRLNEMTKKDTYPLPRIDQTIESMGSAKYYSSLDMGSAFWQVPLSESSKEYTAFACHDGLFQCERMPFGLCNATATF